ncbi:hypothetical protein ET445_16945 [Agromyces protaetiae]|uniref:GNAT family N-acetyltransferase n=1 Tax=Agromyces protaetiae TaxID=2509455 RepID=A0A4P6FEQ2_9MICO|nr:hypothetical protein [Agromyces protaetiae]QAY74770.1 hypothetical protein ET445_16945 [Agromyces protaetiae]
MTEGSTGEDASGGTLLADAIALADAADATAGVVTREAQVGDLDGVVSRVEATWGVGTGPDRSFYVALAHAGATVLVAEERRTTEQSATDVSAASMPVGAAAGFLGWDRGVHLHSHLNAVDPAARGRGIGLALKLRQRAVCLAHGVDEIRWTYDPLIRRNARMNLVRLGAEVSAWLPGFYGDLGDAITGSDRSDRFEVTWRLASPRALRALARGPAPAWNARPVGVHPETSGLALVADFEAVRAADPAAAAALRESSRAVFAAAAAAGLRPELDAVGDYVFTHDDPDREAEHR